MTVQPQTKSKSGPNLAILGLKSPMEVIDILGLLKIDGKPIIKDEQTLLDPKKKAQAIMEFFQKNFKVKPNNLPHLASLVKKDLKNKRFRRRNK
ncbi:MAG: hypothetical protein HQ596_07670 [Candidatus Saganbacteria bacterium]|nr:hypothetical protein [Candidatus Saganbacteria bacterium]